MTNQEDQKMMDQQSIVVTMSLKEFVTSTVNAASKKAAEEAIEKHSEVCEFNVRKDEILGFGDDLQLLKTRFYVVVAMISVASGVTGSFIGKFL